jgi:hypothetical protein
MLLQPCIPGSCLLMQVAVPGHVLSKHQQALIYHAPAFNYT